jgi:hypothetical protein
VLFSSKFVKIIDVAKYFVQGCSSRLDARVQFHHSGETMSSRSRLDARVQFHHSGVIMSSRSRLDARVQFHHSGVIMSSRSSWMHVFSSITQV